MNEDKNLLPHDFKRWHDIRVDEYRTAKALKYREERKSFYDKFATVANKYLSLQFNSLGEFAVLIAHSPADLVKEGNELHHCVGHMGYEQKFVREETLILFIRNIAMKDKPFYTMEYSPKKGQILQCYGENNSPPTESVKNFIEGVWLPYVNKTARKILKKKTA